MLGPRLDLGDARLTGVGVLPGRVVRPLEVGVGRAVVGGGGLSKARLSGNPRSRTRGPKVWVLLFAERFSVSPMQWAMLVVDREVVA